VIFFQVCGGKIPLFGRNISSDMVPYGGVLTLKFPLPVMMSSAESTVESGTVVVMRYGALQLLLVWRVEKHSYSSLIVFL
jgi:hypothetical protein